jgi:ABC-type sugar transport system ATPase subunit
MREELKKIQKELGATILYVTHDQMDAKILGDKICIMNEGRIEQVGNFFEMCRNPHNEFVATFLEISDISKSK